MALPQEFGITAFFIALGGGAASFLSPCVLPLLPAYLSFVSGLSVDELAKGTRKVVLGTSGFVLGFSLVFTILGAGSSLAGALIENRRLVETIAGGLMILFGLAIAGLARPRFLEKERRFLPLRAPKGPAGAFFLGAAFALGWTPCVGPILASILTMVASGRDPAGGALLLFVYSLGLGVPFLLAGLFVNRALSAFRRIRRHLPTVQLICGLLLVGYGVLLMTGRFLWLSSQLARLGFPGF